MTDLSSLLAHAVLLAYDFSGITSIVDVGGGEGRLLRKILELNPAMTGAVLDLPKTVEPANRRMTDGERCSYIAGNFFELVPHGADAYLLCGVVHDWDDHHAITILRNCRKATTKNGRALLVETIVPDTSATSFSKLLDINMMVMSSGRERTQSEFKVLLEAADFKLNRIIPTLAPQSIIEACPK